MTSIVDEKCGSAACTTEFGCWYQTLEEVFVEVNVPEGTPAKQVKCEFKSKSLLVTVCNKNVLKGEFPKLIHADDAIWTLEDRRLVRICLPKVSTDQVHLCWKSLFIGQYEPDAWTLDQMEQQTTLKKMQSENPGFDFSGAKVTGNYQDGGPKLPT